jgi:F-type H+-transporting ATPase subunit delta
MMERCSNQALFDHHYSQARLDEAAQAAGVKEFTELWNKKAPSTLAPPEFPSNFAKEDAEGSKVQGDLFPVNFFTPHSIVADNKQVGRPD